MCRVVFIACYGWKSTGFWHSLNNLTLENPSLTDVHTQNRVLYAPLSEVDPVVQNIIDKETWRQYSGLELIASEVRVRLGPLVSSVV
jgi:hypothetical protein